MLGFYYVTTLLKQAGWPKRRSLFSSEAIIDTLIVDEITDQMIDWSAALGACSPKRALQSLALIFINKDWEGENAPRILDFIASATENWNVRGNKSPHDIIGSIKFSKHYGKTIRSKDLKDNRIRMALEQLCVDGLLWGLANPDRFKSWFESDYNRLTGNLPEYQKAGLEINSIPTLSEYLKECEEMLKGYEKEIDPLPQIPLKLLADARVLGRDIPE
jgi:hypothetical protein